MAKREEYFLLWHRIHYIGFNYNSYTNIACSVRAPYGRIPTNGAKKTKKSTTVKILLKDLIVKAFIIRIDTIMAYCNGWYQQQHWWLVIADFAYYVINRMTSSTFISVSFLSRARIPVYIFYLKWIEGLMKWNMEKWGKSLVGYIMYDTLSVCKSFHSIRKIQKTKFIT